MLQEYWASTVIFIGIFSQCTRTLQNNFAKNRTHFFLPYQEKKYFAIFEPLSYDSKSIVSAFVRLRDFFLE